MATRPAAQTPLADLKRVARRVHQDERPVGQARRTAQPLQEVLPHSGDRRELARPEETLSDRGLDGLEATRRILAEAGENPLAVLTLTTFDLNEYVYAARRAGASGFLLKDVMPEQLIAAVRIVAAGDALIAPAITKRLIAQFARTAPPLTPNQASPS